MNTLMSANAGLPFQFNVTLIVLGVFGGRMGPADVTKVGPVPSSPLGPRQVSDWKAPLAVAVQRTVSPGRALIRPPLRSVGLTFATVAVSSDDVQVMF